MRKASVMTAAAGTDTAAGAAASSAHAGKRDFGSDEKAHGASIDRGSTDGGPQFLRRAEGISVLFGDEVLFIGFIKGKADTGAAASAGGEIHADGGFFLVGEEGVKFGAGAFGKSKHRLLRWVRVLYGEEGLSGSLRRNGYQ